MPPSKQLLRCFKVADSQLATKLALALLHHSKQPHFELLLLLLQGC
jgi:hypothetical protein